MKDRINNGVLQITDEGISEIESLSECDIKRADITGNNLTTLKFLSKTDTKTIKASKNKLNSISADLPSLVFLDVSDNPLKTLDVNNSNAPNLSALIAARCTEIVDIPACINNVRTLSNLSTLVLKGVPLGGVDLTPICQQKTIKKLSLSNCELSTVPWGRKVHKLSNLTELRISGNNISDLGKFLAGCASLKILDAGSNKLTETVLQDVKDLRHLTHITLLGNIFDSTTSDNRKLILEACRGKLKYIDNAYATDEFKQKLEEKRERGNALRKPPKTVVESHMLSAPSAVPVKRFTGNRANTVLIDVIRPIEADPELEAADAANMFTMSKMTNGSSSDIKDSGVTRWSSNTTTVDEDSALDFLLKRPKFE